jgi:hypothetical protein
MFGGCLSEVFNRFSAAGLTGTLVAAGLAWTPFFLDTYTRFFTHLNSFVDILIVESNIEIQFWPGRPLFKMEPVSPTRERASINIF